MILLGFTLWYEMLPSTRVGHSFIYSHSNPKVKLHASLPSIKHTCIVQAQLKN